MKVNKYIGMMMTAALVLTASSCTDFDDYNKVPVDVNASSELTLWDNISQNSRLTNFQKIIQKVGFNNELQQSHFYTVWAPLDGTYDADALLNQDNATVLYRFVKSHIAEHNHLISGPVNERIHALNEKSFNFEGASPYTYADVPIENINLPSRNGVIHTLNGAATFYPNIYEYIFQANDIDSLKDYFKRYENVYLDENNSVVGPTVNGKQTYIDSVMITTNSLYNTLRARIAHEDSSYTMAMPTNEAWVKAYNKIRPYFNYITTTIAQDLDGAVSATNIPTTTATINNEYMADSLTKRAIVDNLIFNNNNAYNRWVEDPTELSTDTLLTTTRNALSNPVEFLSKTKEKVKMSNGYARLMDTLAVHPWEGWAPEIIISPNASITWNGNKHIVRVDNPNPSKGTFEYGSFSYLWVEPTSGYAKPELDIKLTGVLSTTYDIYCVIVPADVDINDSLADVRPNQLDFDLSYCNEKGAISQTWTGANHTSSTSKHFAAKLENDPTKVDTMFVGSFTFPIAYRGLGEKMYPNLKITSDFNVFNSGMMAKYTRDLRIAAIILRPVEMDEYEATKE